LAVESERDDTKMKQLKMCRSAHFVILLTIGLGACGNKGPLIPPEPDAAIIKHPITAIPEAQIEEKETEQ